MSKTDIINDKELKKGIQQFLETAPDIYMAGVSVDTVIFGFHNNKLKALLLRFGNTPYFILPGGYVKKEENLDDAALRLLRERTGLKNIYLEQFYTSGNTSRSKEEVAEWKLRDPLVRYEAYCIERGILSADEIVEMKATGVSLMPEGLLDILKDQQVRDLFAYLRSTQPLVK